MVKVQFEDGDLFQYDGGFGIVLDADAGIALMEVGATAYGIDGRYVKGPMPEESFPVIHDYRIGFSRVAQAVAAALDFPDPTAALKKVLR